MERRELIYRLLARRKVSKAKPRPRNLSGRCWEWTGARQSGDQYGKISIDGAIYYTHRVAAHLWLKMPLHSPLLVRHGCIDNPACFQPLHLRLGTIAQNNADTAAQGRHSNGKLSDADVSRLVGCVRSGKVSIGKWAHLSGVSYCTAYRAYNGLSHREAAERAHNRWDAKQGNSLSNPLLFPMPLPTIGAPRGCSVDLDGLLIVTDPVAAGITADVAAYDLALADSIPF